MTRPRRIPTLAELNKAHHDALAALQGKHRRAVTEQRKLALVHLRALRRSAAKLPWWLRAVFWASVWRETR